MSLRYSKIITSKIEIALDDLSDGGVEQLLQDHRQEMLKHSPVDSVHALDPKAMRAANLTFWSALVDGRVEACVALKQLDGAHAELKSMKVADSCIGLGFGRALLDHVLAEARERAYKRLSLETGSMDVFIPARTLYESTGFKQCPPFNGYVDDVNSVCMSLEI